MRRQDRHTKLPRQSRFERLRKGNMLVLVTAFIFIILLLALVFGLGFVRLIGGSSEQRTAVEAAALAAARDLSRIVINDPECGFVSLSDYAPVGNATTAADGYSLPVRSVNTLIGTARLDMIIGDKLGQQTMVDFSQRDLDNALAAKDTLVTALRAAMVNGGSGTDKDGNTVNPYTDAETAYTTNQIRMTGSSNYVPGSLRLTLGCLSSSVGTAIKVPQPPSSAPVPANAQVNGYYKAFVNVPYKNVDFVFGAIGPAIKLVDPRNYIDTVAGLPYQFPTIVKAEADEVLRDSYHPSGFNLHAIACAQPASVHDPLPAPGGLSISFPDGPVPEIKTPADCYNNGQLNNAGNVDFLTANNGDFPIDAGSNMSPQSWPVATPLSPAHAWNAALHCWIRRAGTKANIDSVITMQGTLLDPPAPPTFTWVSPIVVGGPYVSIGKINSGIIHIFKFASDGVVTYESKLLTPYPLYVSSNQQMYAETIVAIANSAAGFKTYTLPAPISKKLKLKNLWDMYIRNEVYQPGTTKGGKHGGEPLAKPLLVQGTPDDFPVQTAMTCCNHDSPGEQVVPCCEHGSSTVETYDEGSGAFCSACGCGGCSGSGCTACTGGSGCTACTACTSGCTGCVGGSSGSTGSTSTSGGTGTTGGAPGGGGKGWPPMVTPQIDTGCKMVPPSPLVPPMPPPSGSPLRPFYQTTGTAVDIRFRRQVDVSKLKLVMGETGYIGIVAP